MAPLKVVNRLPASSKDGIKTRSHGIPMKKDVSPKRKAEESPLKRLTVKRTASNDISSIYGVAKENATQMVKAKITSTATLKKPVLVNAVQLNPLLARKPKLVERKPLADQRNLSNVQRPVAEQLGKKAELKPQKAAEKPIVPAKPAVKKDVAAQPKQPTHVPVAVKLVRKRQQEILAQSTGVMTRRSLARKSLELERSSDSSLYVSALEDLNLEDGVKSSRPTKTVDVVKVAERKPPPGVHDYDKEQLIDLFSASIYAMDIFDYLKAREGDFPIKDYMGCQSHLSTTMRSLLVDWMVEVQENFEVNHESLYLGVKLVDLYLSKKVIHKDNLQLVGVTGLFIACKYDERIPPGLDDFVYVCDGLYQADDILTMERKILQSVDYQLGIPLSYRFLRRYARCGKYEMPLLTLARYILEMNLMNYNTILCSDSKMAAASLFLALQMVGSNWTETLEYYTGYKAEGFRDTAYMLNTFLHKPANPNLKTVQKKYSHSVFHSVSKTPLIPNEKLKFSAVAS